ncbi:MAG: hypothetical protein ACP5D2_00745 [Candidatus Nanoarchaeia archaeon]
MSEEKFNPPFEIPLGALEDSINHHLNGNAPAYNLVLPPRFLTKVDDITLMRESELSALVRHIPLKNQDIYPYEHAEIETYRTEPHCFKIGQTFILQRKILDIMQNLERKLLTHFSTSGISKLPPLKFYGQDQEGRKALALYIPPFVEHFDSPALIDGIHRSYICSSAGTTINAVHIYHPSMPLPFHPIRWQDTSLMQEKPPKNERYQDLRTELFRDLGKVGIDG